MVIDLFPSYRHLAIHPEPPQWCVVSLCAQILCVQEKYKIYSFITPNYSRVLIIFQTYPFGAHTNALKIPKLTTTATKYKKNKIFRSDRKSEWHENKNKKWENKLIAELFEHEPCVSLCMASFWISILFLCFSFWMRRRWEWRKRWNELLLNIAYPNQNVLFSLFFFLYVCENRRLIAHLKIFGLLLSTL